jgi:hypothetical protein
MDNIKNEIEICEERLLNAMKCRDIVVLGELLHDDLLFNGPTGEVINKDMDLAAYKSGNMVVNNLTVSEQNIHDFGDTAIVSVAVGLEGEFMKQPISGKFRFFRT